jgi:hypothetical protein
MSFVIRGGEPNDLDYIIASWLHAFKMSPEMRMPGLIHDDYYHHQHLIVDELIPRASEKESLYVAQAPGSKHLIKGYLVAEAFKNVAFVHWCQVKKEHWNQGIATALLNQFRTDFGIPNDANLLYTHSAQVLLNKKFAQKACERFNLVYWPWFKHTSQPYGWEGGSVE